MRRRGVTPAISRGRWLVALTLVGVGCDAVSGIEGLRFARGEGAFCEATADCDAGLYCNDDQRSCVQRQGVGSVCEQADACSATADCVEGICCDDACDGACQSCSLPGSMGTCSTVLAGDDPRDACPGGRVCGEAGICQGSLRWAVGLGATPDQVVTAIAVAPGTAGIRDVVVTGTFRDTLTFGDITLTAAGPRDVFVARVTGEGLPLWARSFPADDAVPTTAGFDANAIYVAGTFSGSLTVDAEHIADDTDGFAFALAPGGTHLWTTIVGGPGDQAIADGSLGLDGWALAGSHEGPLMVGAMTLLPSGGRDAWFGLLSAEGSFEAATSVGDAADQDGVAVALREGALAVAVVGDGTVDFGAGPVGPASSDVDAIVARLDVPSFAPRWSVRIGGTDSAQRVTDLAVAPSGDVWATGWTDGDIQSTFAFDHTAGRDGFVLGLEATTGSPTVTPLVGPADVEPLALAATDGRVLVAGAFRDRLELAASPLDTTGGRDGFVVELASEVAWAVPFGGPLDDAVTAMSVDAFDVILAGTFEHRLGGTALVAEGERDGFVARMAR